MSLVRMDALLGEAQEGRYAVGAFNVSNMESVLGAVRAAEAENAPIILQIAQSRLHASPLWIMAPMMLAAARHARVRVAVHFDHGADMEGVRQALELGMPSVMYDGSALPLEENIRRTRAIAALAGEYGAVVEGEVGALSTNEDGIAQKATCANPDDCLRFARETGVAALAVGIGNAHGVYKKAPQLRFDVLEAMRGRVDIPLVLHGGTGLTREDFRRAAALGMCKINVGTALFRAANAARGEDLFEQIQHTVDAVAAVVAEHIRLFGTKKEA